MGAQITQSPNCTGGNALSVNDWISRYAHAWENASVPEILKIFSKDASYRTTVFVEPHTGHDAIATYWRSGPGSRSNIKVCMGRPSMAAERVTVEFWATMTDPVRGDFTLSGCLLLKFNQADGLCCDLWEYWMTKDGWHDPPEGWGV